jgi:hypothetical protein
MLAITWFFVCVLYLSFWLDSVLLGHLVCGSGVIGSAFGLHCAYLFVTYLEQRFICIAEYCYNVGCPLR